MCHRFTLFPPFLSPLTCTNPTSSTGKLLLRNNPKGGRDQTLSYGVLERLQASFIQKEKKEKRILIPRSKEFVIYINAAEADVGEVDSNLLLHFHSKSPYEGQYNYSFNLSTTARPSVLYLMKPPWKCVLLHLKEWFGMGFFSVFKRYLYHIKENNDRSLVSNHPVLTRS